MAASLLAAAGAVAWTTPAAAQLQLPSRKPGQWEMRLQAGGASEAVMQQCVDEATDKEMMDASLSIVTGLCPTPIWSRNWAAYVIIADCQMSVGRSVNARAELSGDFQSSYVFKVQTKTGVGAGSAAELEHSYRWVGKTCVGGLRPGYVRLPNGGLMKLKQMMRLLENMNELP
jgi:hypothetical protein